MRGKTTYNVHQFHFYNIQVIFKKKKNCQHYR